MYRSLKSSVTGVFVGAALIAAGPALADGPPETPPLQRTAPAAPQPAQPQAAPAPQEPVRAAPVQTAPPAAQTTQAPPAAETAAAPQNGQVTLAEGAVLVNVPPGFQFWPASEAQAYLQRANAPAPRGQILGLLAPADARPTQADFWGTVVSYEPVGHVAADSAGALQAGEFETNVRTARANENRAFHGFAVQPAFDPAGSLSWAERTAAQPAPTVRDVRHEQRQLGRSGVIALTSLTRTDQLGQVIAAAPNMAQAVSFPAGQGYADFNASTDRASHFDLPGLVTGQPTATATAEAASATSGFVNTNATEKGGSGGLQGWFPWIAGGVVVLAALGWFAMGRRGRDSDDVIDDDDAEVERERQEEAARHANRDTPEAPQAT